MSDLALFGRTFLIGIAVAAPVGAMGILCIQRTLAGGWRAGATTGLGIATADAAYAAVAAFGLSVLSSALVSLQDPLRIAGGIALVWLGVRAAAAPVSRPADEPAAVTSTGRLYVSAVVLTLTNPMTVMAFGAVFASAGLVAEPSLTSAALATLGVASGSLAWWLGLTTVVAVMRHAVGERTMLWINRASGALVATFGAIAVVSGVAGMFDSL